MLILFSIILIAIFLKILNWYSFVYLKNKVLQSQKWDLNICCGKTDGGGVNADIVKHKDLPNFILIKDIYNLPFKDKQFNKVLCSHTMEHVDSPKRFFQELQRVGKKVTLVTPPLWDLYATLNFTVHKWIVLSFKKMHKNLPAMIQYPLGILYDKLFGQRINA